MFEILGPLTDLVLGHTPIYKEDDFFLWKHAKQTTTSEAYRTHTWFPIRDSQGRALGILHNMVDTTRRVLSERRMRLIQDMSKRVLAARTEEEFDHCILDTLGSNPKDAPFALLYHVEGEFLRDESSRGQLAGFSAPHVPTDGPERVRLRFAGSVGVPDGHPSAALSVSVTFAPASGSGEPPKSISTAFPGCVTLPAALSPSPSPGSSSASGSGRSFPVYRSPTAGLPATSRPPEAAWPFAEAIRTRRPVLVEDCSQLIAGYKAVVWDEVPTSAVVLPIAHDSNPLLPNAVLIVGLSVRRPFDSGYKNFIEALRLQVVTSLTAVRSFQTECFRTEELAGLDRAKSVLFTNVSHELRTPLTLIAGPIEDLVDEMPPGPQRDALVMARRNTRRMTRLVSMLMDVSKLEAGRLKGAFRRVNLGVLTRENAGLFKTAMDRGEVQYIVECDLTPHDVYIDPEQWEKILFNLVGNAMKYTLEGYIKLSLTYTATEAICTVTDTGVGIPSAYLHLVGERFFRDASVSSRYEGTGIGLSLTKKLIELHNGVLEIESKAANQSEDGSHGSVFRVRLP